ncbi:MAG: UDP-N-acetyl-D-glucosamine 2-epimerase, UDP-hydrolysing [Acidobacteria bacterium RIFCSPLOWO2_02_FULL_68_18]|nr:MAG: UDP-N-acetyl-D-glucosamine 2-epimerase, UDP-hydrolysing [Acidobacteria bacterium RIFCSPLOWO2_02_FULL_68_18]OFW51082.1 MAG: UDP-N-acetyl-D-glucosamine 2-epimerase, UDP-hydrolysing [Acidobacteria bacterium RIFCSPLOWO2_12_FULL_68_19]
MGAIVRKVCVFIGSRANYSSIKSAMRAIDAHPDLELQLVVGASALLDRFGSVVDLIEADGFTAAARVTMIVEGETPATMAKSTGLGLLELPTIFEMLKPDVVMSVGDRFETMATAVAAAYMNIPVAHTMGGEISGTIDESIRHAVTKLAHVHFPANAAAGERIVRMGEPPETVHVVGCPRIDLVAEIVRGEDGIPHAEWLTREGVGAHVDPASPFLLVNQHPVTTEYGHGKEQIWETLMALEQLEMPTIMLWPNVDAGSEEIATGMRTFREKRQPRYIRFYKNFPIDTYVRLMLSCGCVVGNSSAPIREGAFLGVPTVNIGTRQRGRDRGPNVVDVGYNRDEIVAAVRQQLAHGRYRSDPLYGDGQAGGRIADLLARVPLSVQKRLVFAQSVV